MCEVNARSVSRLIIIINIIVVVVVVVNIFNLLLQ